LDEVIATAGVVVVEGDHVLLIEHGEGAGHVTGAWGIPAGGIDPEETARTAAARELFEETGLRVDSRALLELPTLWEARVQRKVGSARFSLRAFATDQYEGELAPSDEGTPTWIRLDRVARLRLLLANTADIVHAAAHVLRR
jgi:8-oxo-dGTP pyrophosphatase MutT (NUDIX family)